MGIQSSINDGLLDVILFKDMNFMELLPLAINVLQGRHDENKNVIYFQTPSLTIESPVSISTDVDGENGEPLPLHIEIIPRRLLINTSAKNNAKKADRVEKHERVAGAVKEAIIGKTDHVEIFGSHEEAESEAAKEDRALMERALEANGETEPAEAWNSPKDEDTRK